MDILHSRYKLLETLGQGGIGTTYKAQDLQTQQSVAIKVVSLRQRADWKTLDLFDREVRVLKQLNHLGIPQYLDSFEIDTTDDRWFCIVQALAPGKTLAEWIEQGWQPDEATVQAIALQLLEILVYLQTLLPPIFHRDIKPQNILRDRDGTIYLVDFGAVQDTYHQTVTGGSTVVGTLGYMAPEQFRGKATLATDLYGLGTTLLFLLTGKDPINLQQSEELQLKIPNNLPISGKFKRWLQRCLEIAEEDRFASAAIAISALQDQAQAEETPNRTHSRPRASKVTLIKTDRALQIHFSSESFQPTKANALYYRIALSSCYLVLALILIRFISISALNLSGLTHSVLILIAFPCTMAMTAILLARDIQVLRKPTSISVNDQAIALKGMLKPFEFYQSIVCELQNIEKIYLDKNVRGQTMGVVKTHAQEVFQFGTHLSAAEQRWLVQELQDFVQAVQHHTEMQADHSRNKEQTALEVLFQQGIRIHKNRQLDQATTLFHAILLLDSSCAEAQNNLGVISYHQQQWSAAIQAFQTALQLAPSYWAAQLNLAIAQQAQGNREQAIAIYGTTCLTEQKTGADDRTLILYDRWHGSLAAALSSHAFPPPEKPEIAVRFHRRHADLLQFQGNFAAAIELHRHRLTLVNGDPARSAEIYADLAWALAIAHRIDEAWDCLKQQSHLAPKNRTRDTLALIRYLRRQRSS